MIKDAEKGQSLFRILRGKGKAAPMMAARPLKRMPSSGKPSARIASDSCGLRVK